METKEEDIVDDLFVASTHSYLLFFTNRGKVHWLKVHEIPEGGRQAKGKAMVNLLSLGEGRSEEHTSELQSRRDLVCRLLLEKKKPHVVARGPAASTAARR